MFMAEKLIITEEVKKQNNMAYKMRSGNKVSFKNMGSSPAKQTKVKIDTLRRKGTEAKDENKIFDDKGNHIGNYVNGKKVMLPKKSTTTAHGQLDDAQAEYETDKKLYEQMMKNKKAVKGKRSKPDSGKAKLKSPLEQKDKLDMIQQGQRIASDQIDLEEKRFQAATKANKRDRKNRINPITGTTT